MIVRRYPGYDILMGTKRDHSGGSNRQTYAQSQAKSTLKSVNLFHSTRNEHPAVKPPCDTSLHHTNLHLSITVTQASVYDPRYCFFDSMVTMANRRGRQRRILLRCLTGEGPGPFRPSTPIISDLPLESIFLVPPLSWARPSNAMSAYEKALSLTGRRPGQWIRNVETAPPCIASVANRHVHALSILGRGATHHNCPSTL